MRTVILTDCHIGSGESNYRDVKAMLSRLSCDELVLGGDFWDLWDMSPRRLRERYWDVTVMLERVKSRGAKIIYVIGNHDEDYLKDPVMPASLAITVRGAYPLPGHPRRVTVVHGHEFDPIFQNDYWLYRAMAWVNKLSVSTIGVSAKTFKQKTVTDRVMEKDFPEVVRQIHAAAMAAYAGKCDCLIMGHTHCPIHEVDVIPGLEFVNAGDWKWSNTWAEVNDGVVSLNEFQRQK